MRHTVFQGSRFWVERIDVPTRDGGTRTREVIRHPGAVAIVPVLGADTVVLIRNTRHTIGETLLEIPAGTRERGEDPAACAARELIEETGYRAARITPLCTFFTSPGITDEVMHVFVAHELEQVGQALEDTEHIEVELVGVAALPDLLRDGAMRDAKTIASLLYFLRYHQPSGDAVSPDPTVVSPPR